METEHCFYSFLANFSIFYHPENTRICLHTRSLAQNNVQNHSQLYQRVLFSLFDISIMPQIVEIVRKIILFSLKEVGWFFSYYYI